MKTALWLLGGCVLFLCCTLGVYAFDNLFTPEVQVETVGHTTSFSWQSEELPEEYVVLYSYKNSTPRYMRDTILYRGEDTSVTTWSNDGYYSVCSIENTVDAFLTPGAYVHCSPSIHMWATPKTHVSESTWDLLHLFQ